MSVFLTNFLICFLLSFCIGVERQYHRRLVGLRTTVLVSIGAFLFVYLPFYLVNFDFEIDVTRVAASVVSGIGFLGAGVILKSNEKIKGLTTAATLWCDTAVGALCAIGATKEALIGTVTILFANIILRYINLLLAKVSANNEYVEYLFKISSNKNISNRINNDLLNMKNMELIRFQVNHNRNFNIEFNIITKKFNTVKAIDEYLTQYPLINKEVIRKSSSSYVEEEL